MTDSESTRGADSGARPGSWLKRHKRLARALVAGMAVAGVAGGAVALSPRPAVATTAAAHPGANAKPLARSLVPVPALGIPFPGPMTYGGGQVELAPKVYLVYWGWPGTNDPVQSLSQNFVSAIGGTSWAAIDTQYYESVGGQQDHISNPTQLLAGVWYDTTNPIHDNLSMQDIGNEAQRGVQHFGITDLADSNVVVMQPKNANDAGFNQGQYCAWHDWSTDGYSFAPGTLPFAFTSIPYVLNAGAACGQDFVNKAPGGDLDGVTMVLGHEIAEAITDPGAGVSGNTGWMDLNQEENGDKCAWVDIGPGSAGNITGNDGRPYAVQSLWDNTQLLGLGYCSG